MQWAQVVADPSLRDLPYKIELNEHGQIVMTPRWPLHSELQSVLQDQLNHRLDSDWAVSGYTIQTAKGVRVADIAWRSDKRWRRIKAAGATPAPVAPEICIEVRSLSNRTSELEEKRTLYFDAGALEVWICDETGKLEFFGPDGELSSSKIVPSFPSRIEI